MFTLAWKCDLGCDIYVTFNLAWLNPSAKHLHNVYAASQE